MSPITLLLASLAMGTALAGESLEEVRAQFEELREDAFAPEERFDERFIGELKLLRQKAVDAGNLDLIIEIDGVIAKARAGAPVEISSSRELAPLQRIYLEHRKKLERERETAMSGLLAGYRKRLEELEVTLTRADAIAEAIGVRKAIAELDSEVEVAVGEPSILGVWKWHTGVTVTFLAGGKMAFRSGGRSYNKRWNKGEEGNYVCHWSSSNATTLSLSGDVLTVAAATNAALIGKKCHRVE